MMKSILPTIATAFFLTACSPSSNFDKPVDDDTNEIPMASASPTLETEWVLEGFDAPESIIPSASQNIFFVSNVNGEGDEKDGNGYISQISADGQMITKNWATGLNAPKGMALSETSLFVSDIDQLVEVDINSGSVKSRTSIEGAKFLNDVAVFRDQVLVADSGSAQIFGVKDGNVSTLIRDEKLGGVNGLLLREGKLLITTMDAGHLLEMDPVTGALTQIATGMENADGIAILENGFLISSWPGHIHFVSNTGDVETLIDTTEAEIFMNDIYYDERGLFVPNWLPGTVRKMSVN